MSSCDIACEDLEFEDLSFEWFSQVNNKRVILIQSLDSIEKLTQIGSEESEALKTRRNKSGNAIRISLWVSIWFEYCSD